MSSDSTVVKDGQVYHRYNMVTHGLYFSGIMRCSICKLDDCPIRKEGELCGKELAEIEGLEEMDIDQLREKIVVQFGKLLIMLMVRSQIQLGFGDVNVKTILDILEKAKGFTTSSKGGIRKAGKGLAELLSEEKGKKEKGGK